jgi:hypothetical protein
MSESTGPIIALGGITVLNRSVFNGQPFDMRIPIATGLAAGLFALGDKATGGFTAKVAWLALVAVVLTRVDPKVPAPAESFLQWWEKGRK